MSAREMLDLLSILVLPALLLGIPILGLARRVAVYEEFVDGAKEGFGVAIRVLPYLVAMLFAIGMFRASGAMDALAAALGPLLAWIGVPAELLPMAIVRPLTGSGSAAIVADMVQRYGEDSLWVKMAATMYGSTETTFYVVAVYFGAIGISKVRHAVAAGLLADLAGFLAAIYIVNWLFG